MPRSPLFAKLQSAQAQFTDYHGWEIPSSFGSVEAEYWALKEGAGLLDCSHRGRLRVHGQDAPRFLHGMVTNEIRQLPVGKGNYAFLLDVRGHILADVCVFRLAEQSYWLDCEPQLKEGIRQILERHIIADLVEVEDPSTTLACLAVEGPCAREIVREVLGFDPPHMHLLDHMDLEDARARLARAALSGEEGYWIWVAPDGIADLWDKALESGARIGVRPVGWQALEICRMEAGVPRYGVDMDEKTLPQETGQMHALSFTKGCYLGQEVVERIRSRGHVNRKLVGLLFEGKQEVAPQTPVMGGGQSVGILTSSAYSFGLRRTIALAYLKREHAEAEKAVRVGNLFAEVSPLPFFTPSQGANSNSPSA